MVLPIDDPDDLVAVELSSRKKEKSAENPNTDGKSK